MTKQNKVAMHLKHGKENTMKWLGSTTCDMCNRTIKTVLYDAKVVGGPWATMCHTCWKLYSYNKLGTGLGQKYKKNDEGDFIKEK